MKAQHKLENISVHHNLSLYLFQDISLFQLYIGLLYHKVYGKHKNIICIFYWVSFVETYYNMNCYIKTTFYSQLKNNLFSGSTFFRETDTSMFNNCVAAQQKLCSPFEIYWAILGVYWRKYQLTSPMEKSASKASTNAKHTTLLFFSSLR